MTVNYKAPGVPAGPGSARYSNVECRGCGHPLRDQVCIWCHDWNKMWFELGVAHRNVCEDPWFYENLRAELRALAQLLPKEP